MHGTVNGTEPKNEQTPLTRNGKCQMFTIQGYCTRLAKKDLLRVLAGVTSVLTVEREAEE